MSGSQSESGLVEVALIVGHQFLVATGGDKELMAYYQGDFNEAALTLGTGHTLASIREGLRGKGIQLVPTTTFAY